MVKPVPLLQKIRREERNLNCADCGIYNKYGFGQVCAPYKSFVCSLCKTSHQAISHRVKSITMSTFTLEEVRGFKAKNGGGNDQVRKTWYGRLSDEQLKSMRPQEGEHVNVYKAWINKVYEEKAFYKKPGKKKKKKKKGKKGKKATQKALAKKLKKYGNPLTNSPEKNKKLLQALIKMPGNRVCADCPQEKPTWASATLGVFVCIKCSGVHRRMGTHISFVRSVTLDSWKPQHVANCVKWGNTKAAAYWEARMPASVKKVRHGDLEIRPEVERLIRAKYEQRRFIPKGVSPEAFLRGDGGADDDEEEEQEEDEEDDDDDDEDVEDDAAANKRRSQQGLRLIRLSAGLDPPTNPYKAQLLSLLRAHDPAKVPQADQVLAKFAGREEELLAKLRSKYGAAAPAPAPAPAPTNPYKAQLLSLLRAHDPAKVPQADQVLANFAGREEELLAKLRSKYGAAAPAPAPAPAPTNPYKAQLLSLLRAHDPAKVPQADQVLAKFAGREEELLAKLRSKYGVAVSAPAPAPAPAPADEWGDFDSSADTGIPDAGGTDELLSMAYTAPAPAPVSDVRSEIRALVQKHEPANLAKLDAVFKAYAGKEMALLRTLRAKYGVSDADVSEPAVSGGIMASKANEGHASAISSAFGDTMSMPPQQQQYQRGGYGRQPQQQQYQRGGYGMQQQQQQRGMAPSYGQQQQVGMGMGMGGSRGSRGYIANPMREQTPMGATPWG